MPTIFQITSALSNQVLDVPLSQAPIAGPKKFGQKVGNPVQQWDKTGGTNQEWTLQGQGYLQGFQIVNHASGLVIGVNSNSHEFVELQASLLDPSLGTSQQDTAALDRQLWLPQLPSQAAPSGYNLINKASNLVLDIPLAISNGKDGNAKGLPIQQYASNFGLNQQWSFTKSSGHTLPMLAINPLGPTGGDSPLILNGTGFTSQANEGLLVNFYGPPVFGAPGASAPVKKDGTFSIQYTTQPANSTMTFAKAESTWVSCYITDENRGLIALASVQLLYFVATNG